MSIGIRNTFYIKNTGYTSNNPLCRRMFCLKLCCEYIGGTTLICLVNRALINTFVFFSWSSKRYCSAIDHWHNTVSSLRETFVKLTYHWVPSSSINLETKYISTFFARWEISFPIEFLQYISLNCKFIEFEFFISGELLLDGCQE